MQPQQSRPFRIRDAIVLTAAVGVGLAGWRLWTDTTHRDLWPPVNRSKLVGWLISVQWMIPIASIMLLSLTVAVLLLRIVDDRPRRRRLWSQPGFLACVGAVCAFAWKGVGEGIHHAVIVLRAPPGEFANLRYGALAGELFVTLVGNYPADTRAKAGEIILIAWLIVWASGRCRPEPNWIDRFGRVLGAAWVCVWALDQSLLFYFGLR